MMYHYDKGFHGHDSPETLRVTDNERIPRIIHYCWFGRGRKSELNEACMKSWKAYCGDYQIIEWNEDNYDIKKHSFLEAAYKAKAWAYVSDYVRLDVVLSHGGIYVDTDVELLKSTEDLLYMDAFMGVDRSLRISLGLGFGSIPGHRGIRELLSVYDDISFSEEKAANYEIISPELFRPIFKSWGYEENGKYQHVNDIYIFPERILSAFDSRVGLIRDHKDAFMAHHYEGTWADQSRKKNIRKTWEIVKGRRKAVNHK
jgi:mannosyltransferase OCH1-like enzyme